MSFATEKFIPTINEQPSIKQNAHFQTHYTNFHKKKSRISLAVEKSSSRETLCERETKASSFSSEESLVGSPINSNMYDCNSKCNIQKGFDMCINISVVIVHNIKQISLNVNTHSKISIIIEKAICEFNKEFHNENAKFRIRDDSDCYVLKPAKKNGKPKSDFPYFNENVLLHETQRENFTLCWKDNPEDYSQMFEIKKKSNMCLCSIF